MDVGELVQIITLLVVFFVVSFLMRKSGVNKPPPDRRPLPKKPQRAPRPARPTEQRLVQQTAKKERGFHSKIEDYQLHTAYDVEATPSKKKRKKKSVSKLIRSLDSKKDMIVIGEILKRRSH